MSYSDSIKDSVVAAGKLNEFLGGSLEANMAAVINPKLYQEESGKTAGLIHCIIES